jgi:MtN3 and saliva related transmembrane protein
MLESFSATLAMAATVFGILMSLGYFPQTLKIVKRKSSADVSLFTYLLFAPGAFVWLIYGISINNLPLIVSNIISSIGAFSVIASYYIYKK